MNIANAKIIAFLRTEKPGVLALVGPSGCGKRYTIAEAARQTGVATTHHDLAHDAVAWGQLGSQQLAASTGLARCAHVVSNASEPFLRDFAFAKKTQAKIILVADDAGQSIRTSGVPIVRMQAMTSDAMAKKLFLDLEWPAEEAVAAARHAKGDWHQLHARSRLCRDQTDVSQVCSEKDASIVDAPPCFVANQLLNGTAPHNCPLDPSVVAAGRDGLGPGEQFAEDGTVVLDAQPARRQGDEEALHRFQGQYRCRYDGRSRLDESLGGEIGVPQSGGCVFGGGPCTHKDGSLRGVEENVAREQ